MLAAFACARLLSGSVAPTEVHVGPSQEFGSLEAARDHIRSTRHAPGPTTILVHPGTYPPFALTEHDARAGNMLISVVPDASAPAIISGAKPIPTEAFQPVGTGPLVRANLFEHNISAADLGRMVSGGSIGDCQHEKSDFIFGGRRMTLARWPNVRDDGYWQFANVDTVAGASSVGVNLTTQPAAARMRDWAAELNPWIHGYWTFDWTDSYVGARIAADAGEGAMLNVELQPPTTIKPNARFYGVNLLCELDQPGEYYINEANGTLYFYPPEPLATWAATLARRARAQ